jgi:2-octaprenyl-6-methoxyphenol hydroxylase
MGCEPAGVDTAITVLGGGPVGLAAARALAAYDLDVVLVAPPVEPQQMSGERRTAALFGPSVALLQNLGVWSRCVQGSAPIRAIRIADARDGLVRAPELAFHAHEIGRETFGSNIANAALVEALAADVRAHGRISWIPTSKVTAITSVADRRWELRLAEGMRVTTRLLVAADGRNSIARQAANISVRTQTYPQTALVATFAHARPHNDTVLELHGAHGPCTTVPMPGNASSLVWVESPETVQMLLALEPDAFAAHLEERLQGVLGAIDDIGPRASYPLSSLTASRMGASGVALIGEAAHVIPPIGAQGLNLGLRDVAVLADCVADACAKGADVGGDAMLDTYHRLRSGDVTARSISIDVLNRSLLSDMLPVDVARSLSARLIAAFSPLRRYLMHGGMGHIDPLPRLMRPNASVSGP